MEAKRSDKWPTLRKHFLQGKSCAVCGGTKKLELHHIIDFRDRPDLELDIKNLIALCEGDKYFNHHLLVGHLGDFERINPNVVKDAKCLAIKIQKSKNVLAQLRKSGKR